MSDDRPTAIEISHVSKQFQLPHEKVSSLKGAFTSMMRRDKSYTTQKALDDITFEIKQGEFFGIVGRNGSGKSTLLKIIAGIYQPTEGHAQVHGKLVPFIELGVGFNPELTGRENVYLNGSILGFTRKQIDAYYEDVVDFAELEQFMDQKLKNYSSGMQVRLAFACATRAEADVLLVDEVLAVGDTEFQRKCFSFFKELKRKRKTVIFVTHDMSAVREYCDKAILIDDSRITHKGTSEEIADAYDRMFTKNEPETSSGESGDRWGSGEVKITSPKAARSKDEGVINFSYQITAATTVNDLVVGFMLKDAAGSPILGTNSQIKKQRLDELKGGETLTVSWTFPDVTGPGEFYFDPAVIGKGGGTYDWWQDAIRLRIAGSEKTPHIISPNIGLRLDREK